MLCYEVEYRLRLHFFKRLDQLIVVLLRDRRLNLCEAVPLGLQALSNQQPQQMLERIHRAATLVLWLGDNPNRLIKANRARIDTLAGSPVVH